MDKLLVPWAEDGTRTAFLPDHDAQVKAGWVANDQPAAENWNYVQGERDDKINATIKAGMTPTGGVNPDSLDGLDDDRRVPILRPNAFAGPDAVHLPQNAYNTVAPSGGGTILDATMGWDPSIGKPIMVFSHTDSMSGSGTSADLTIAPCWVRDFSPFADDLEERTVNFGATMADSSSELPILVCDGYLYVVAQDGSAYTNRTIFKYDLLNWTGNAIASLSLGTGTTYGPNKATELIEISDTQIGIMTRHTVNNTVRAHVIEKDLSSQSGSSLALGVAALHRFLKSDGYYMIGAGTDTTNDRPYVFRVTIADGTMTSYNADATYDDTRIVDMVPISSLPSMPAPIPGAVLCVVRDTTETVPCRLRSIGTTTGTYEFNDHHFEIMDGEPSMDNTKPAGLCSHGACLYVAFNRTHGAVDNGNYIKTDLARLALPVLTDGSAAPAESYGNFLGHYIQGTFDDELLRYKLMHDGRDMWSIDFVAGGAWRIVAPEART